MSALPVFAPPFYKQSIITYPDTDGHPMAENGLQYRCITDTRFALE